MFYTHRDSNNSSVDWAKTAALYFRHKGLGNGEIRMTNSDVIQPYQYISKKGIIHSVTNGLGDIPAILAEVGNMNNPQDLRLMTTEDGQWQIAHALAASTVQYYSKMRKLNPNLPALQVDTVNFDLNYLNIAEVPKPSRIINKTK